MPKYRMIAIDLDGTLLGPDGSVSDRARDAVRRALSAGLLVCFATGRNWTESRTVLDAVEHYGTAVFVGGAMVIDTGRQVTLHRTTMQPALAAEVCAALESWGHAVLALQDTGEAGVDYLVTADLPLNRETAQWMERTSALVQRVTTLGAYHHDHTIRVGICADPAYVAEVKGSLLERFGDRILCHNLNVPSAGVEVLEIFDPAVNKWEGVLHVARAHGITPEEIVAIGDDGNDVPLIRGAGLGVAMGNAKSAALEVADRVIGANHEEGLAAFIDELLAEHAVEPLPEAERGPGAGAAA